MLEAGAVSDAIDMTELTDDLERVYSPLLSKAAPPGCDARGL